MNMIGPRHASRHPAVWVVGWAMTAGTWAADPARANSPFYVASELGGNFASALQTSGTSNDRASVCDEFINPMFATVTRSADYEHYNCTGAQRGRGSGWKNGFDHAEGLVAGADGRPTMLWNREELRVLPAHERTMQSEWQRIRQGPLPHRAVGEAHGFKQV